MASTRSSRAVAVLFLGIGLALVAGAIVIGSRTTDPDLAQQARDDLRARGVVPLSAPLSELLQNAQPVESDDHPLINESAPDFDLPDSSGQRHRLSAMLQRGPVVLVFYYGFYCDHCVSQLFALKDDLAKFRELGAEVVAVSADPPEETAEKLKRYGAFGFPVLADVDNRVAEQYGVFTRADDPAKEVLLHGTFVLGRDGGVGWAKLGDQPFTDNKALLLELARIEGR